eukprot:SAG31_NODE_35426_length_323_cov_0.816964_1_plen_74_part_10
MGVYFLSAPLVIKPGNFSVMGSGIGTMFNYLVGPDSGPDPAVMHIQGGGGGLKLMNFQVYISTRTSKGNSSSRT